MKVGDLVTLSAAGRKTQDVEARHKRFFVGPKSNYWNLAAEDTDRFHIYWDGVGKIVGLITKITNRHGRTRWDSDVGQYVTDTNTDYWVAWQANPKPLSATQHRRGHLKFVKKHKKK